MASGSQLSSRQQSTIDAIAVAAKEGRFSSACRLHFCLSLDINGDDISGGHTDLRNSSRQKARDDSVIDCAHALPGAVGHQPVAFYDEAVAILHTRREADKDSHNV